MTTEDDLIQLICWLASVVTKQADVRHEAIALPPEECRQHIMMQSPIVQTSRLQMKLREIGDRPVDQDALRRALEVVCSREESVP